MYDVTDLKKCWRAYNWMAMRSFTISKKWMRLLLVEKGGVIFTKNLVPQVALLTVVYDMQARPIVTASYKFTIRYTSNERGRGQEGIATLKRAAAGVVDPERNSS